MRALAGTRRMLMIWRVGCLMCLPDLMPSDSIRSSMPFVVSNDDDDDDMVLELCDVYVEISRR